MDVFGRDLPVHHCNLSVVLDGVLHVEAEDAEASDVLRTAHIGNNEARRVVEHFISLFSRIVAILRLFVSGDRVRMKGGSKRPTHRVFILVSNSTISLSLSSSANSLARNSFTSTMLGHYQGELVRRGDSIVSYSPFLSLRLPFFCTRKSPSVLLNKALKSVGLDACKFVK